MAITEQVNNGFDHPEGNGKDNALFIQGALIPETITFTPAAGGSNVSEVTVAFKDGHGNAIAYPILFDLWLSDAATGLAVTGTSASGTVTAKSASGSVFDTLVAKKALKVQSLANGTFVLEITDTAKTAFYVCAQNPATGQVFVSTVLATANYG